jgi:hypothetical protein
MFYVQIGKVFHDLKGNVDDFITSVISGVVGVLLNSIFLLKLLRYII